MSTELADADLLKAAVTIVNEAHAGQMYGDKPYTYHLGNVVNMASELFGETNELVVAALLHDVIEDSTYIPKDLLDAGIPKRIVDAVSAVTRRPLENTEEYVARIKENDLAFAVKLADASSNLLESIKSNDGKRVSKYTHLISRLINKTDVGLVL